MDKNTERYAETGVALIAFIGVASCFPSGYPLVLDNSLINFWALPAAFLLAWSFLDFLKERNEKIPKIVPIILSGLANGAWSGLSFGSVLILNQWYANPEVGTWEPLLVAAGFSSAAILAVNTRFNGFRNDT
jgi:hypothetical protein